MAFSSRYLSAPVFRRLVAHVLVALFVLPVVFLLRPFLKLRLVHLYTARLGNLATNTHQYLANRIVNGPEQRTLTLFFGYAPCNRQLFTMWQRRITLVESRLASALYHYLGDESWIRRQPFLAPLPTANHLYCAIALAAPVLSFTAEEEKRGQDLLRRMGLGPDDWFVCFHARDPDFHAKRGAGGDNKQHRNCRIETFLKAARHIVDRGGHAIRVGSTAESPLPDGLPARIVDYTSNFRGDFGDIYLLGSCRFMLGSGAGTSEIPPLFGKPVAQTNHLPLVFSAHGPRSLFIPKLLRRSEDGELATFADLARRDAFSCKIEHIRFWDNAANYRRLGLEPVDNDEDEILDACLDMLDRIEGRAPPEGAVELQRLFKRRFLAPVTEEHEYAPDIGPRFALKYRHLIES